LDFILCQWWPGEDTNNILTFEDFVLIISSLTICCHTCDLRTFSVDFGLKGVGVGFRSQVMCAVLVSSFFMFDLVGDLAIGLDQTSSVVGKFQTDFVEPMRRTNYWVFCCRLFLWTISFMKGEIGYMQFFEVYAQKQTCV
jgi:hypothetical protein